MYHLNYDCNKERLKSIYNYLVDYNNTPNMNQPKSPVYSCILRINSMRGYFLKGLA